MTARRQSDCVLLAASLVPLVYTLFDSSNGDVPLYYHDAQHLFAGGAPYRDWVFEYPPYALLWFVLPGLAHGYAAFRALFSLQILALDIVAKLLLLREGDRTNAGGRPMPARLGPFLVFSLLGVFQSYFYQKRLDAAAAALVLFALLAFGRDRLALAGALLAVAAGTKLYPALAMPALLCVAYRRGRAGRFLAGAAAGLFPIALASPFLPWWRFASFQAARGLQVESTYGSVLWLLHFFGLAATWHSRPGCCIEVGGPTSEILIPVARALFGAVTLAAVAASVATVWPRARDSRSAKDESARDTETALLGRVILLPIVGFMVSSVALSPQFAVWPIGPAALAFVRGKRAPLAALAGAVVLTAFVFPAPGYFSVSGIALGRSLVVVARNGALVVALVLLACDAAATVARGRATSAANDTVLRDR
jgi:glycosyl transferase family 87